MGFFFLTSAYATLCESNTHIKLSFPSVLSMCCMLHQDCWNYPGFVAQGTWTLPLNYFWHQSKISELQGRRLFIQYSAICLKLILKAALLCPHHLVVSMNSWS